MSFEKTLFKSVFPRDAFKKFEKFTLKVYFEDTFSKILNLKKMSLEETLFKNSKNEKCLLKRHFRNY